MFVFLSFDGFVGMRMLIMSSLGGRKQKQSIERVLNDLQGLWKDLKPDIGNSNLVSRLHLLLHHLHHLQTHLRPSHNEMHLGHVRDNHQHRQHLHPLRQQLSLLPQLHVMRSCSPLLPLGNDPRNCDSTSLSYSPKVSNTASKKLAHVPKVFLERNGVLHPNPNIHISLPPLLHLQLLPFNSTMMGNDHLV